MSKHIVAALLFLFTVDTLADARNREKARFDLISSIEVLVNIDECRKGIHSKDADLDLPRACNSLPRLSKYFYDKAKDKTAIDQYLDNEEARTTEEALSLVNTFKFTSLGKMILSSKCVKNRDPVDLDVYLNRIRGVPVVNKEEENPATQLEQQLESKKSTKNDIIPMELPSKEIRNPATKEEEAPLQVRKPQSVEDEGLFQKEMSSE